MLNFFPINFLTSLLPYLCLVFTVWFLRLKMSGDLLEPLLYGSLGWLTLLWCLTYLLSFFNLLYPAPFQLFWSLYFILALGACLYYRKQWKLPKIANWLLLAAVIAVCALAAALFYPPNNYDVLTYHMPRVMHWLQNHSLAPYQTSIDRQIGMAPLNALIALNSCALAGVDYSVNLAQWLAFCGCLILVWHLTLMLTPGPGASLAAVIFAATLPCAIIQASNTDSCLLASYFILAAVLFLLRWIKSDFKSIKAIVIFGMCSGYAILAKGSAYPLLLPCVAVIGWHAISKWRKCFLPALGAGLIIICLNLPHFYYTYSGTGNFIASSERNVNLALAPNIILGNLLYNFLLNEPILLTGHGLPLFQELGKKLGLEDRAAILPWGGLAQVDPYFAPADGTCPNPLHALTAALLLLTYPFWRIRPANHYATLVIMQAIAFCALLTWHPWMTRIQISLFFLIAPIFGCFLQNAGRVWIEKAFYASLAINSVWPVFMCVERPLFPSGMVSLYRPNVRHFLSSSREELLFNGYPRVARDFIAAANALSSYKPDRLYLEIGDNGMEYPVWVLLQKRMRGMPYLTAGEKDKNAKFIWYSPRMGENAQARIKIMDTGGVAPKVIYPPK